jgi:hypothetical protein
MDHETNAVRNYELPEQEAPVQSNLENIPT